MNQAALIWLCALLVFLSGADGAASAADIDLDTRTVAIEGQLAPGLGTASFGYFGTPALNNYGCVAFYGSNATIPGSGIWKETANGLVLAIRNGTQAPGAANGQVFNNLAVNLIAPFFDDAGEIAFRAALAGTGVTGQNDFGIWSETGGNGLALVAREGDLAPGLASAGRFIDVRAPLGDVRSGSFSFWGQAGGAVGADNGAGLWLRTANLTPSLIAHENYDAPGAEPSTFVGLSQGGALLNSAGDIAFFGYLNSVPSSGIWLTPHNAPTTLVARGGDRVPGTPNERYGSISDVALDESGYVTFIAESIADIPNSGLTINKTGVWYGRTANDIVQIASTGSAAPGLPSGTTFESLAAPIVSGNGRAVFSATLTGGAIRDTYHPSIWASDENRLHMVAQFGDRAPDTPAGVTLGYFGGYVVNDANQIAFSASLDGSGVSQSSGNTSGLWAQDRSGALHKIVREGDQIDVDNGPGVNLKTVSQFAISNANSCFNDRGQMVFNVSFTDGTDGIFVSNAVAVPEPTSLLLVAIAVILLVLFFSRHC